MKHLEFYRDALVGEHSDRLRQMVRETSGAIPGMKTFLIMLVAIFFAAFANVSVHFMPVELSLVAMALSGLFAWNRSQLLEHAQDKRAAALALLRERGEPLDRAP